MAVTDPQDNLGNYFYITLNNISGQVYRGVPFIISWGFQGASPLATDTVYLYVNDTLVFTTQGESIKSYTYTPTSKNINISVHIDTGVQKDTVVTDDNLVLTAKSSTLISDVNYIKSALKKILTKKNISYTNNDTISTLVGDL